LADTPFRDHNHFDAYAGARGWVYDNGWGYQDKTWDAYAGPLYLERSFLVMLRDRNDRHVLVLHYIDGQPTEVWSGPIENGGQFDELAEYLDRYIHEHTPPGVQTTEEAVDELTEGTATLPEMLKTVGNRLQIGIAGGCLGALFGGVGGALISGLAGGVIGLIGGTPLERIGIPVLVLGFLGGFVSTATGVVSGAINSVAKGGHRVAAVWAILVGLGAGVALAWILEGEFDRANLVSTSLFMGVLVAVVGWLIGFAAHKVYGGATAPRITLWTGLGYLLSGVLAVYLVVLTTLLLIVSFDD